jgi:hypothetical protein
MFQIYYGMPPSGGNEYQITYTNKEKRKEEGVAARRREKERKTKGQY